MEINEAIIRKATTAGNITFSTRDFGRGTKFVCRDRRVIDNGGVHIIQTFWAETLSEELHIKSRTTRQGNNGSY